MADESTMSSADDFDTVRDIRAKGTRASSADELSRKVKHTLFGPTGPGADETDEIDEEPSEDQIHPPDTPETETPPESQIHPPETLMETPTEFQMHPPDGASYDASSLTQNDLNVSSLNGCDQESSHYTCWGRHWTKSVLQCSQVRTPGCMLPNAQNQWAFRDLCDPNVWAGVIASKSPHSHGKSEWDYWRKAERDVIFSRCATTCAPFGATCTAPGAPPPPAAGGASAALPRVAGCYKGGWNDITHKDGVAESFRSCESACTGFDYFAVSCGGTHVTCHCISEADLSSKFVNNATRAVDCEMSTPDPVNRANCALDRTFTDSAGNTCKAALSPTVRAFFRRP